MEQILQMKGDQAIMQSSTHSITSTKEYKEKIKTESKSETNLTQSSSSLTEVVQLDPNVSIIPWKSKPAPNMQAYFTEDELSKKKEIAGKKLNLREGPKRVDNIVTKINDIEKTEEEKTEEKPKTSFVSKPLPPPPPKRPTGRGRTLPTKKEPAPTPSTTQEGSGMQSYILLLIIIFIIMYFYMKKN